jgi:hypothetical protein
MKNPPILAAIALLAGSGLAGAATVLYETDFTAPTYSDAALIGQDGWVLTNSTTNPLSVTDSASSGTVVLTTTGQDVRRAFTESAVTSGSVYMKAEITVSSAQAAGDYFLHLGDNSSSNFYARTYIKSSGTGFVMALGTSSGTATYGTIELAFDTPLTLLVRYDLIAGTANDTGALFINPTTEDGSGDTAYVAATTVGTDATTISSVSLRQGSASNAAGVIVDSISVFVPEPGVAMLGGLGVLGLLRRRRL